jgi:hypothetical protein
VDGVAETGNIVRDRVQRAIAGHQDLATTQRYMHLSPAAVESAIQLLDAPGGPVVRGNMMATRSAEIGKSR